MKTYFSNLKKKPEHVRVRYAYTTAGIITLLISLVWVTALVVTKPFAYKNDSTDTNLFAEEQSAFQDLTGTLKSGLANVNSGIEQIKEVGQNEGPARLEIVETKRSSTVQESRPTTISF